MNGVKQKFNDEETKVLFSGHDLLIIMETFFLKRHKTPDGFLLVGKSDPLCDARREGVLLISTFMCTQICVRIWSYLVPRV